MTATAPRKNLIAPQNDLAPFSCTYTPNLPELLQRLDCSIIISTFQAGKIVVISPEINNFAANGQNSRHRAR